MVFRSDRNITTPGARHCQRQQECAEFGSVISKLLAPVDALRDADKEIGRFSPVHQLRRSAEILRSAPVASGVQGPAHAIGSTICDTTTVAPDAVVAVALDSNGRYLIAELPFLTFTVIPRFAVIE
jgi:hypothetical protein